MWKGVQDEQCSANELASLLFSSISCSAKNVMGEEMIKLFKESNMMPSTKYQIQLDILKELCEKEDFATYMKYIIDPFGYTRKWFESRMENYYTKTENVNIILEKCVQFYDELIYLAIKYAETATDIIKSELIEKCDGDVIKQFWKTEFLKLIQPRVPNLSNTTLVIFDAYEIENYDTFFQAFRTLLIEKRTKNVVAIPDDFVSLPNRILDEIIQCRECCPLCNEMCQRNRVRHDHYCDIFHRPLGVYGVRDSQNQLVRDTVRYYSNLRDYLHLETASSLTIIYPKLIQKSNVH